MGISSNQGKRAPSGTPHLPLIVHGGICTSTIGNASPPPTAASSSSPLPQELDGNEAEEALMYETSGHDSRASQTWPYTPTPLPAASAQPPRPTPPRSGSPAPTALHARGLWTCWREAGDGGNWKCCSKQSLQQLAWLVATLTL
jgi:hypothetical protein